MKSPALVPSQISWTSDLALSHCVKGKFYICVSLSLSSENPELSPDPVNLAAPLFPPPPPEARNAAHANFKDTFSPLHIPFHISSQDIYSQIFVDAGLLMKHTCDQKRDCKFALGHICTLAWAHFEENVERSWAGAWEPPACGIELGWACTGCKICKICKMFKNCDACGFLGQAESSSAFGRNLVF